MDHRALEAKLDDGAFELVGFDAHAARTSAQQTVERVLDAVESIFVGTREAHDRRCQPSGFDEAATRLFAARRDAAKVQRLHAFGHLVRHFARQPAERRLVAQNDFDLGCRLMQHRCKRARRRGRIDHVARNHIDRFRRQRAHEHAAVAVEDCAATRERFDGLVVLRQRQPREMRAVANLHRTEPHDEHRGQQKDQDKRRFRPYRRNPRESSRRHASGRDA